MARAIGLDIGSKTIGIAITDELRMAAHPSSVWARVGTQGDVAAILAVIADHQCTDVIVGIPYELSGREGPRAKRVRVFVDALLAALPAGITLNEQDERFTTAAAERVLLDAGLRRDKRKAVIDQQAAALILGAWLDAHR